ncbi:sulfite exporter TauE/SafE family protein [uncultured Cyclobacterium sp.]|uniref:sulfite exporter TauE/SafE family protein n=1 Tax=uncultured Cyclobacterium sp. TaxID=453820 RepID=UPI0030EDD01F|tara:strand:+ start:296858 stop:297571 length:714 start_codon:yes stop_codon:yes gene_type:complete
MIWTAFIWGMLGSFHCIGMCGPIALALAGKDRNKYLFNKLLYNSGRAVTYSLLGGLVGLVGFSLSLAGIQQWLSIVLGLLIIGLAYFYKESEKWIASSSFSTTLIKIKSKLGKSIKRGGSKAFFVSGILNGFLPCGMVYMALVASLALQGPVMGMAYMFVFGLGTFPVMLLLMFSKDIFSLNFRMKMNKAMPYFVMFMGVLFVLRGMGWGIPYLSPTLGLPSAHAVELLDSGVTHCE